MKQKDRWLCLAGLFAVWLFFFWLFHDLSLTPGDDYMYRDALQAKAGLPAWIWQYYLTWSGRLLPSYLYVGLLALPLTVMGAFHALCMTWVCWFGARWFGGARGRNAALGCVLFAALFWGLCNGAVLEDAVLWCSAAPFYLWCMAAAFLAVRIVQIPRARRSGKDLLLSAVGAFFASWYEQAAPLILGYGLFCFFLEWAREKKWCGKLLTVNLISLCVLCVSYASPGNFIRSQVEVLHNNPAYPAYGFLDKLVLVFVYLCSELLEFCLPLLLLLAGVLAALQLLRRRWAPFGLSCLITLYFLGAFVYKKAPAAGVQAAGDWLYGYLHNPKIDFLLSGPEQVSAAVGSAVLVCLGLLFLFFLNGDGTFHWGAGLFYFGSLMEIAIIAFTPAEKSSRLRILFPSILLLLMVLLLGLYRLAAQGKEEPLLSRFWKKRQAASLAAALLLSVSLAGCGSAGYDSVVKSMDNSLRANDPQRAAQLGEDWLESHRGDLDYDTVVQKSQLYQKLYEIYRENLSDEVKALAILEQGYQDTGDGELFNLYFEEVYGTEAYQQLAETFPSSQEILLDGRPFDQWSPQQLWDYFPVTEDSYQSQDENGWYRSEDYKNGSVTLSYFTSEYSESLDVRFSDWGEGNYTNLHEMEGPEPQLPCDIQEGDSLQTVLEKLGLPQELAQSFGQCSYVSFYLRGDGVEVYPDMEASGYQYLSISYDTRDYYGSLEFDFKQNGLTEYRMSHEIR